MSQSITRTLERWRPFKGRQGSRAFRGGLSSLALTALGVTALSGVGCDTGTYQANETRSSHLRASVGANGDILGMETSAGWSTTTPGVVIGQSTTHSQGSFSLSVAPSKTWGWTPLKSVPLSTLEQVSPTLAVDVMLPVSQPNPGWLGQAQAFITCPSRDIRDQYMGLVELTGKPLGVWTTLTFPLDNYRVSQLLKAGYSDLQITIVLNAPTPPPTGVYLVDNVRFLPVATNGCRGWPNGTMCTDNNACTRNDSCQGGSCVPGTLATCGPTDQCHNAGTCNPSTGLCSNPTKPDGTACNDDNGCTQTDTCQVGTCVGSNPKTCTPPNQCHTSACVPTSGICQDTPKPNGSPCDDGNACTQPDQCEVGACIGNPLLLPPPRLTATPGSGQVNLTWTAGTGAVSYNVMRGSNPGGPYSLIANVATTSYLDEHRPIGPTFYYVVTSVAACGESAPCGEASAVPYGSKTGSFPPGPGPCKAASSLGAVSEEPEAALRSAAAIKQSPSEAVTTLGKGPKLARPKANLLSKPRAARVRFEMTTVDGKTNIVPVFAVHFADKLIPAPALSDRILVVGRSGTKETFVMTIHDPRIRRPLDKASDIAVWSPEGEGLSLMLDLPESFLVPEVLEATTFEFYAMHDVLPANTPVELATLSLLMKGTTYLASSSGPSVASVLFSPGARAGSKLARFTATKTSLLHSGPEDQKYNLVIIGDGYQAADQANFDTYVENKILKELFGANQQRPTADGPLWEDMNAFNITRVNVDSQDNDVTLVRSVKNEAMQPDAPSDGKKLSFTFTALANTPIINGLTITDPTGNTRMIRDHGSLSADPLDLYDGATPGSSVVTGTIGRSTGVVVLNYKAGNAPPAGNFSVTYAAISVARSTALDTRFSGDWDRCYFDDGPNTQKNLTDILDGLGIVRDFVAVVLNHSGHGGCGGSGRITLTRTEPWTVYGHEAGHMIGALCDEYNDLSEIYKGGEPTCVNMTINTNRSTLKWREFVDPNTPLPTDPNTPGMDPAEVAGAFEGGDARYAIGIWRPHINSRMKWNTNAYGPVGYDQMKKSMAAKHEHDFTRSYVGDFDGNGVADVVVHNANSLALYLSDGTHVLPKWIQTLPLDIWDSFAKNDKFLVGDFNGDGRDDLAVYNMLDFEMPYLSVLLSKEPAVGLGFDAVVRYDGTLPGWDAMKPSDRFFVGDFDGDGKDDLYVVNTDLTDWPMGYLGMLRSNGTGFTMASRYDETLPGWDKMKPGDRFFVANADGLGGKDLYVSNAADWCGGYLVSLLSNGSALGLGARYDKTLPGWGDLLAPDQFFVASFEGNAREGLYAFNGTSYAVPYLGVLRSVGNGSLDVPLLHEGHVEGWDDLKPNDHFLAANVNGQGGTDLFSYNLVDWGSLYVGRLLAYPDGFQGSWQSGSLGKWNTKAEDVFHVGNFSGRLGGAAPLDDLIVHNDATGKDETFGVLINDGSNLSASAMYRKWIHHHLYHSSGYW